MFSPPRQTYNPNYYPGYSRDPRALGDPRYYGRGTPYQGRPPYGSPQTSGKIGTGPVIGCAVFVVILIVAVIGAVALGLIVGLSPNNSGIGSAGNGADVPSGVDPAVSSAPSESTIISLVDRNDIVAVDTVLDTTIFYNLQFNDPSNPAFQALESLVLPPIDRSFRFSDLASIYQGLELISATNNNGRTRIVVRSRFYARSPLVTTDENAAVESGTILAGQILLTDALDGDIQDSFNVLLGSVQSTGAGLNIPTRDEDPGGSTDSLSITCPDNILRSVSDGQSTTLVGWAMAVVTGTLGSVTYTEMPVSNSNFPLGLTVVTIIVGDVTGSVGCTFVVEIVSSFNSLSVTCPENVIRFAEQGQSSATASWDPPVTANADGEISISYSAEMSSLFPVGTTIVVALVSDSTTAVQCNFEVIVQVGSTLFMIICPNDRIVGNRQGEEFAILHFEIPEVIGQPNGRTVVTYSPSESTLFRIGMTTVVATVRDDDTALSCTFVITVIDDELPVVLCPAGGDRNTDPGRDYATISWVAPTATDNMDNSLQVTVNRLQGTFRIGGHTVIAMSTDSSGNTGSCSWTYNVRDMEPPVVTCPSPYTVRLPSTLNTVVISYENLVTARDNVATGITINIDPSDLYPFEEGTYQPIATATDSSGNSRSCSFTLTVTDNCGKSSNTLTPRIIGGQDALAGQFPWMASLTLGTHYCGSVIINENWVLTAAHCPNYNGHIIIAGDVTLPSSSPDRQTRRLAKRFDHPSFVAPPAYDIALLGLDSPLIMTDVVQPACLTTVDEEQDLFDSGVCKVTGWGTLVDDITAPPSNTLREVTLNVYTRQECETIYNNNVPLQTQLTSDNICAGFPEGQKDACHGDSGGGLVCPDVNNFWHVVGLVSSGRGCGQPEAPGIYTRTSQFNDFIYAYLGAELVVVDANNIATFSSPLVNTQYPNNVVKGWRFRRFGGSGIRLEFTQFLLAFGDTLTLGEGLDPSDSSTILQVMDSSFTSVLSNYDGLTDLWFRFESDSSQTANGFLIRVRIIP